MSQTVADVIIDTLAQAGATRCYGVPGDTLNHVTDEQLSVISEYLTIEPGDILFTGSPSGSAGVHGNRWLKDGDRIHAEIESVGVLDVIVHDDK